MTTIPKAIARLKRLPQEPDRVWQGGVLDMSAMLDPDGPADSDRIGIVLWGCEIDDLIGPRPDPGPLDEIGHAAALMALVDLAGSEPEAGYRPGLVEVCDPELAAFLEPLLADADIEVGLVDGEVADLPALAPLVNSFAGSLGLTDDRAAIPALADAPGIEIERIVAFAHAAARFHVGEPWLRLSNIDLIRITAPTPPPGLEFVTVQGQLDEYVGLSSYGSYEEFRARQVDLDDDDDLDASTPRWLFDFADAIDLPQADRELWLERELPPHTHEDLPSLSVVEDDEMRHPRADELTFIEGLLRALAQSSEDDLDSGRWRCSVATCDGRVEYALELPDLLEPPSREEMGRRGWDPDERANERLQLILSRRITETAEVDGLEGAIKSLHEELRGRDFMAAPFEPADDRERAQDLCYHAYDSYGRRRIALARQALVLWPECADARVILAEVMDDPRDVVAMLEPAVAAGLAHVDQRALDDCAGDLWAVAAARGYLRALQDLIGEMRTLGRLDEAIGLCEELQRLDRGNRVGAWRMHVLMLADQRRDEEMREVVGQVPTDDPGDEVFSSWMLALAAYRIHGDGPEAVAALREARERNRYVGESLAAGPLSERISERGFRPGRQGEAQILATVMRGLWDQTVGAVAWAVGARTVGGKGKRARPGRRGRG